MTNEKFCADCKHLSHDAICDSYGNDDCKCGTVTVQYGHKPSECAAVHAYNSHFEWTKTVIRCGYMLGTQMCQEIATNRLHQTYTSSYSGKTSPTETIDACKTHFSQAWNSSDEKKILANSLEKIRKADASYDDLTGEECAECGLSYLADDDESLRYVDNEILCGGCA